MPRFNALGLVLFLAAPAVAQTSFPMVTHCTPTAIQRGTTAEIAVDGQMNFAGAYKVLIGGTGVTAEVVKPKDLPKLADPKALPAIVK